MCNHCPMAGAKPMGVLRQLGMGESWCGSLPAPPPAVPRPLGGTPTFSGSKGAQNCYTTPVFSGVPNRKGTKSELATSPLPSRGAQRGRKCYATHAFSGAPNRKGRNSEWATLALPSQVPKECGIVTQPLCSRGSRIERDQITTRDLTLAFSGAPKRAERPHNPCVVGGPR